MTRSFVYGIDFNHDKPEPNWQQLWNGGTRIIALKATQGGGATNKFSDPTYLTRLTHSMAFPFMRCAWTFVNNDKASDQAKWFIDHAYKIPKAAGVDVTQIVPGVDFEGNPTPGDTSATGATCLAVCQAIEDMTGLIPLLYTNADYLSRQTLAVQQGLTRFYGWFASYVDNMVVPRYWTARTIGDLAPQRGQAIIQQYSNGVVGPQPHDIVGFPTGAGIDGDRIEDSLEVVTKLWQVMATPIPDSVPVLLDPQGAYYIKQFGDN